VAGLRDRKKQEVRQRILDAAVELFTERGIDGGTMEDVAAAADVSVATVYNYFGTKSALIVAGVEEDTDRLMEDGRALLARPGRDPRTAARRLIGVYIDHLTAWDRKLLTEVLVAMFQPGEIEMTAELMQMDERAIAQLAELLQHFQEKGLVDSGIEATEASLLLFSIVLTHIVMWLSLDDYPVSQLKAQVDRQVDLAFTGIAAKGKPA
jgi:AcrR family transcriptional regulator